MTPWKSYSDVREFAANWRMGNYCLKLGVHECGSADCYLLVFCSMLLGRLAPQEIAIALFESDTYVVKGFGEKRDLDEVTNRLLELAATGGTRVDACPEVGIRAIR